MEFTYIYRTSEGARLEARICAPNRDEAFAALRARGIRPIKVIARDGNKANGDVAGRRRHWPSTAEAAVAFAVLAIIVCGVYSAFRIGRDGQDATPDGRKATIAIASPLERQAIPGDRRRIALAKSRFRFGSENVLAQFAEPGRAFELHKEAAWDWGESLKTPLKVSSDDLSEVIDLKRIVAGMKREAAAYLAGGGTWDGYVAELVKRQRLEIAHREGAEKRLNEALEADDIAGAYDIWLKANAQLDSMGIFSIPIPQILREYQANMNFEY